MIELFMMIATDGKDVSCEILLLLHKRRERTPEGAAIFVAGDEMIRI